MSAPERFHPDEPCRNCGDETPGNYCPTCGQAKRDAAVSVRVMVADFLEDQLLLNRVLPHTLRALLLSPGLLTREFMAGRKARYVAPFRLYIGCSVVFLLLFATFGLRSLDSGEDAAGVVSAGAPAAGDSTAVSGTPAEPLQPWTQTLRVDMGSEATSQRVFQRIIDRWGHLPARAALRAFFVEYLRYVPQMVFVLLPLFAVILKALYARSGRLYAEHFVFSLHVHAFAFAAATLALPLGPTWGAGLLALALIAYGWTALRNVYGQGWLWTTLKGGALGLVYAVVLQVALLTTMVVTLLRL